MSFTLNTGIAKVCLWAWSYCQWVQGIILYCVTLYPVVLRLIKEIEKRLWHLWHYLLRLVTEFHSSDLPSHWHTATARSVRRQEIFATGVTRRFVTNSFTHLIARLLSSSLCFSTEVLYEPIHVDAVWPLFIYRVCLCYLTWPLSAIHP